LAFRVVETGFGSAVAGYQPIAEYVEVESGSHNDHERRDEAEIAAEAIQLGDVIVRNCSPRLPIAG